MGRLIYFCLILPVTICAGFLIANESEVLLPLRDKYGLVAVLYVVKPSEGFCFTWSVVVLEELFDCFSEEGLTTAVNEFFYNLLLGFFFSVAM